MLLVFDNTNETMPSGRASTLMGDALVLIGASGYAANNVLTEYILKTGDAAELLGGMGSFGIVVSAVLVPVTESKALSQITWTWPVLLLLAAYGVALFLFSLGMPILLHRSGSTVRHLRLRSGQVCVVPMCTVLKHARPAESMTTASSVSCWCCGACMLPQTTHMCCCSASTASRRPMAPA